MIEPLNIGDIVEYSYNDGKKDLIIGIVVDVENNDGHYEDEYSVLWLNDDERTTVYDGFVRSQLIKVSE
jgi:hypothetical protein